MPAPAVLRPQRQPARAARGTSVRGCASQLRQLQQRSRARWCGQRRAVAAEELAYFDVVEYSQPGSSASRLGLVQQVDGASASVQLCPLVEEDEGVWVPEGDAEPDAAAQRVGLECVQRVVESAYGQRQDKAHNPHGEHAHDVWQVLVPLPPSVWRGAGRGRGGQ